MCSVLPRLENQTNKTLSVYFGFKKDCAAANFQQRLPALKISRKKSDVLTEFQERLCSVEFLAKNACLENQQKKSNVLTEFQERLYRADLSSGFNGISKYWF